MTEEALIDGHKISELRRLNGLSLRAFARLLAVAPMTMKRIEENGGHGDLTLRFATRMADELGVDLRSLLPEPAAVEPEKDDVLVEAALADLGRYTPREELAHALGWTLERTVRALALLGERLESGGTILKQKRYAYFLGPRPSVITEDQHLRLQRAALDRWGMHLNPARVLRDVLDGTVDGEWERNAPAWKTLALGALLKHRLVRMDGPSAVMTDDVRFSLELEDPAR